MNKRSAKPSRTTSTAATARVRHASRPFAPGAGRRRETPSPARRPPADRPTHDFGAVAVSGPTGSASIAGAGGAVIQRQCGTPGCTDPNCHDPSNHGFDRVFDMRSGPLYNWSTNGNQGGRGTGTSRRTRNYVNDPNTTYPEEIRMSYSGSGGGGGFTEFENAPLRPGQRADAGHIRGRQNFGYGNQNPAVFPQNPQQNRGNYIDGERTRHLWREHEDEQRSLRQGGQNVNTSVLLRNEPRPRYPEDQSAYDPPGYDEDSDMDWEEN